MYSSGLRSFYIHIPLTYKIYKSQPQTGIFPGNKNRCVGQDIQKKKKTPQFLRFEISLQQDSK